MALDFAGKKKRKLEERKESLRQQISQLENMSEEERFNHDYELGSVEGDVTEKLGYLNAELKSLNENGNFKLRNQ
tara:strand:- start:2144 stop:2368 length:225 start_codon:yes stop_codon:yes gene_type:complete